MNHRTLALIATLVITAPAFAMAADTMTVRLNLGGLDLNTPDGAQTALDRISAAAEGACSAPITGSRIPVIDVACKREMVTQAVRQLQAPKVSALLNAPAAKANHREG